jgi:hypothetical protein
MKISTHVAILASILLSTIHVDAQEFKSTKVVTKKNYLAHSSSHGIILLDINWGRIWSCGEYENAQLVSLNFSKYVPENNSFSKKPELSINTPSKAFAKKYFKNYAFMLPEGEYALHSFKIKVAKSIKNVGYLSLSSDELLKDQKPLGGSFSIKSGEQVFIGNFSLDCTYGPTLWRYHSNGLVAFKDQVNEYKRSFPFLNLDAVTFRLFKTSEFGYDYELPTE